MRKQAELVGISLATGINEACYIPIAHRAGETLFDSGLVEGQLPLKDVVSALKDLLSDPSILKIAQNVKYDLSILKRHGLEFRPYDDTMLISYALDCGRGSHGLDELAKRHLNHTAIAFKDVTSGTKRQKRFFAGVL